MLTLGDRIRHIRSKILRLNQAVFADNLGFSRIATISDYEKNKRNPDIIALRKMASLANVTIEWLLTGNGPIFMPGTEDSKETGSAAYTVDFVDVKVYDMSKAKGPKNFPGRDPLGTMRIPKCDFKKGSVAVRVKGNSMYPTILDGAIAGIDVGERAVVSGSLYAAWLDFEGATVKRVFVYPDRIVLKPDNPAFPETTIPAGSVGEDFIIGKVVWLYQRY
ncbi:MAG: helix-turn-helix transcriptional regulator [Deltaproteobacteria bacterium]|nr:helix-turn-helix transcriptional regulator [Deltaproteobacteria bacterium]